MITKEKKLTYETRKLVKKARDEDVRRNTNILALEKQFMILDKDIRRMISGGESDDDLVVREDQSEQARRN